MITTIVKFVMLAGRRVSTGPLIILVPSIASRLLVEQASAGRVTHVQVGH